MNAYNELTGGRMNEKNQRIIDYFAVIGLPPALTATRFNDDGQDVDEQEADRARRELLFPTLDTDAQKSPLDPITDITVVDQHLGERVPEGYDGIWLTPAGHSADLNHGSLSPHPMHLAVRRSRDELPITDIGVFYEDTDLIKDDCYVVRRTAGGNCANVNNATLTGNRIFITYRRAAEPVCNSFAVTDVCVIIKSKGESPPHSFNEVAKNLNTGIFGASVYLCYKKSMILAPQIRYMPATLFRYPMQNHADIQYPHMVENFGLPMGANIECWPHRSTTASNHKPFFSSFVIMLKINDGPVLEKVYGTSLTFHEDFDEAFITAEQAKQLGYAKQQASSTAKKKPGAKTLHANKCILLLSRHPFFESFRTFLFFIYNKYTKKFQLSFDKDQPSVPVETYLAHLIYNVPFPTFRKPRVSIYLTDQDSLDIQLPAEIPLPHSAASYVELLENLGVENTVNVFLFILLQRSVMVHSLRPSLLTGVVEAISSLIFPFTWRSNYLPQCPFNLRALIDSPVPIILGMDSRYFDLFEVPINVLCVDLDTNSLSWTPERELINLKMMPKAPLAALKERLERISHDLADLFKVRSQSNKLLINKKDTEAKTKSKEAKIELSIREAFLRFMAAVLHDYKSYLRTVTKKPDVKAQDRNLAIFFDPESFILSKDSSCRSFYSELIRTQSFCDFIIDVSFTPEHLADSFGFFADCCSKVNPRLYRDDQELIEKHLVNDQTVVVMPPSESAQRNEPSAFDYTNEPHTFPRLRDELHDLKTGGGDGSDVATEPKQHHHPVDKKMSLIIQNTPIGVRTQADKQQAKKKIERELAAKAVLKDKTKNVENKFKTAKIQAQYLLSNAYSLWFIYFSECLKLMDKESLKNGLDYAYQIIIQMHKHGLQQPDEICFRIIMQLCLVYKEPILAVKTLSYMRMHKINACQMTRSYYNTILTDPSNWPSSYDRWARLRMIWSVSWAFRRVLKLKIQREEKRMKSMGHKSAKHTPKGRKQPKKVQNYQTTYIHEIGSLAPANPAVTTAPIAEDHDSNYASSDKLATTRADEPPKEAADEETKSAKNSSNNNKSLSSTSPSLSCSLSSINKDEQLTAATTTGAADKSEGSPCNLTPVAFSDPLSAFVSEKSQEELKEAKESEAKEVHEIQRRLFDYKPFAEESKQQQHQERPSDFIFTQQQQQQQTPLFNLQHYNSDGEISKSAVMRSDPSPASSQNLVVSNRNGTSASNESCQDENNKSSKINNKFVSKISSVYKSIVYKSSSTGRKLFDMNLDLNEEDDDDEDEEEYDEDDDEENDYDDEEYEEELENGEYADEDEEVSASSNEYDETPPRNYRYQSDVSSVDNYPKTNTPAKASGAVSSPRDHDNISLSSKLSNSRREYSTPNFSNSSAKASAAPASETTPFKFINDKFGFFRKKVESSLESSGSKLKSMVNETLSKDTFISNVLVMNKSQITDKLKTISSYQISSLAKLNSFNSTGVNVNVYDETNLNRSLHQTAGFNSNNNNNSNAKSTPGSGHLSNGMLKVNAQNNKLLSSENTSQTSLDSVALHNNDLDDLPLSDESYTKLNFEWWGIDLNPASASKKQLNTCASIFLSSTKQEVFETLVQVDINSCNYCENCKSLLYDEDIMSGWTINDSDLNIRCIHCLASFVPRLFIKIVDFDDLKRVVSGGQVADQNAHEEASDQQPPEKTAICQEELVAPYLSPLVVRKEIENILTNRQHNHDDASCVFDQKLSQEHPEIYWNLLWYFKRIGVDNGQLVANLLNARLKKILDRKNDEEDQDPKFLFQFKKIVPNKNGKPYDQHSNLKINCEWDSLKQHCTNDNHELPLYLSYLRIYEMAISKKLESRLITIQPLSELSKLRSSSFGPKLLNELFVTVIKNIKESDTTIPVRKLLSLKPKMKNLSIYREILFLIMIALDREKIDLDAFDNEYRKSYRLLLNSESQSKLKQYDRPPNDIAVWCRRLFSPLLL